MLHGISFSIESGKALGLLGRNGAGKTTTIRILMDVFRANSGTVTVDGKPFHPKKFRIGYLPEERGLYPKKGVLEQLMYLAQLRGSSRNDSKKQAMRWLERLGVEEYAQRKLETLSKGNQQKVQLAQTLVCDPELVILDEPFSGLDPVNSADSERSDPGTDRIRQIGYFLQSSDGVCGRILRGYCADQSWGYCALR